MEKSKGVIDLMSRMNNNLIKVNTNRDKLNNIDLNGQEYSTNYILDDIINAFKEANIDNDELIKKLTIQSLEYGRTCIIQTYMQNNSDSKLHEYITKLDDAIQKNIIDVGGIPKQFNGFNYNCAI